MPESSHLVLKRLPLFGGLGKKELEEVGRLVIYRKYRRNTFVFTEGEPGEALCFVKSGRVKISKTAPDGREQILHIMEPGDIFGEIVLFVGGPYPATAETVEDSEIGMIRNQDIEDLIRRNGEVALTMLKIMARRLKEAQAKIRDLALKDTPGRTAGLLLRLAQTSGVKGDEGIRVPLDLSRQELASMIGTSRETITRILCELDRQGIINLDRYEITIRDPERLKTWE